MALAAVLAWWDPVDAVPRWVWLAVLFAGGLLVAVALGIRSMRP